MASKKKAKLSKNEKAAQKAGISLKEYKAQKGSSSKSSKSSSSKLKKILDVPKVDTSQLKALQGKYEQVVTPTQEETDTNTQLGNIITSKELGVAKAEQEPMAQQFVTGQSAALEKSAALKSMPLQTKLANLQARRNAAADVLRAQLGFETSSVERQSQSAESAKNRAVAYEEYLANREFQEKQFSEGVRQFNVSQAKSGSSGTWSNISLGGKVYKINSKTGEIQDTGLEEQGAIDKTVEQLRKQGWSDDEIKAYLLSQ